MMQRRNIALGVFNFKRDLLSMNLDEQSEIYGILMENQLLRSFFVENGSAALQIKSYETFIENGIPKLFEKNGYVFTQLPELINGKHAEIRVRLVGKEIYERPKIIQDQKQRLLYPSTCRLTQKDYVAIIKKTVKIETVLIDIVDGEQHENIVSATLVEGMPIVTIPIMVSNFPLYLIIS